MNMKQPMLAALSLRRAALAVLLLGVVAPTVEAQSPVRQGERVRAMLTGGLRVVGTVMAARTDSLGVLPDGNPAVMSLALSELQGLERSIGQQHQGKRWAMYGGGVGFALGFIPSVLLGSSIGPIGVSAGLVGGLITGTISGIIWGGLGFLVGYAFVKRDIWMPVEIDRSESRGFGLVLGMAPAVGSVGMSPPVAVGMSIPIPR